MKTYQPKILLLLYASCPKSTHILNYFIYTKCNIIWCWFQKTSGFFFQKLVQYSWVLSSSITTIGRSQPNSLSYFYFTITLSALSTRKARPKHGRQPSYLRGTTLVLAQEPELDLKNSVFFITLNHNIFSRCKLLKIHDETTLSQVNSS